MRVKCLGHTIETIEREGLHYALIDGQETEIEPAKYPRVAIKRAVAVCQLKQIRELED